MSFATKQRNFFEIANDTAKRFSLEAFSFTHQAGLNLYFEDLDDLKEITQDVEFEFWSLSDHNTDAEIDVDNFSTLKLVLNFLENVDADNERLISTYEKLVAASCASWDTVEDWHDNNFVCEYVNQEDFGIYLVQELSCLEIPDELQNYFDYQAYGRDMLQHDYCVVANNVYRNL